MRRMHDLVTRIGRWVWAPLLAKGLLWMGAFAALAHVGTNAAARVVDAPAAMPLDAAIGALPAPGSAAASSSASARSPCPEPKGGGEGVAADGRVVLNEATAVELQRLPGVGRKRAEAIVEVRTRLGGRFRSVRDLLRVRGIGIRSLKRLEPLVVLDAPSEDESR